MKYLNLFLFAFLITLAPTPAHANVILGWRDPPRHAPHIAVYIDPYLARLPIVIEKIKDCSPETHEYIARYVWQFIYEPSETWHSYSTGTIAINIDRVTSDLWIIAGVSHESRHGWQRANQMYRSSHDESERDAYVYSAHVLEQCRAYDESNYETFRATLQQWAQSPP